MNLYKTFKANDDLEKQGIELQLGDDVSIRLARAGGSNQKFGKLLGDRLKPYRRQIDNGTMDDAVAAKIMAEVYADCVVLGWQGVADENGNPLALTRDNCVKLFTDLPELFRVVQEEAGRLANFRAQDREEDAKN